MAPCCVVSGRDYVFDSVAGADANDGTSREAPYQTLAPLAPRRLVPGDRVLLKCGSVFRGVLAFEGNGTETAPIQVIAYGTGPKPEILGSIRITDWQQHDDGLYSTVLPSERGYDTDLFSVHAYEPDSVPRRMLRNRDVLPTAEGTFHFDPASRLLHVKTWQGLDPREAGLEVPVRQELLTLRQRSWLRFEGLTLLFGGRRHIVIRESHDLEIRDCASLFVGLYGNPNISMIKCERVNVLGCFLYESVNCGVYLSDQTTRCRIADCTIVKCWSNDGVTIHSGGRDNNGVRQGIAGDHNIIENNVIGLCPEESIDITSGDEHIIRGNICYGNGNPGIIVGHDSDHIRIENNISFGNARSGIHVAGQEAEGARGHNIVAGNLMYDNGYPGLEIQSNDTLVCNNTVVDATARAAVRINALGHGSRILNNIIVTTTPEIRHPSLQFLLGNPRSFDVELDHNLFFSAARPDGRFIQTDEGNFTLAEMSARYASSLHSFVAKPGFAPTPQRHYRLTADSPAVNRGRDVGLHERDTQPDCGWQQHEGAVPPPTYPAALITGAADHDVVLWLWGKAARPPSQSDLPFAQPDVPQLVQACLVRARDYEQQEDWLNAWRWYEAALFRLPEAAEEAKQIRERVTQFAADDRLLAMAREQFAERTLLRAQHFLSLPKKKWPLIAHYLQVAARSAGQDSSIRRQAEQLLTEHRDAVSAQLR